MQCHINVERVSLTDGGQGGGVRSERRAEAINGLEMKMAGYP